MVNLKRKRKKSSLIIFVFRVLIIFWNTLLRRSLLVMKKASNSLVLRKEVVFANSMLCSECTERWPYGSVAESSLSPLNPCSRSSFPPSHIPPVLKRMSNFSEYDISTPGTTKHALPFAWHLSWLCCIWLLTYYLAHTI